MGRGKPMMIENPKCCFTCPYYSINPPIMSEPSECLKGAKKLPGFWSREDRVAEDCPLEASKRRVDNND
jgi:hypothetical protein